MAGSHGRRSRDGHDLTIATVSHELRNPLAAMRGHVELLQESRHLVAADRAYVEAIERASARLERLLDDLLAIEPGAAGAVRAPVALVSASVAEAVDVTRLAARRAGVGLDVRLREPEARAAVPQADLDRAVLNLLTNAVKFSTRGQEVHVEQGVDGNRTWLTVRDHGPGIRTEDLDRVFAPFFRAPATAGSVQGTGLGLAIVRDIMARCGGEVSVVSTLGGGSTFTLDVPLRETVEGRGS